MTAAESGAPIRGALLGRMNGRENREKIPGCPCLMFGAYHHADEEKKKGDV